MDAQHDEEEIPLAGGNVNDTVVRIGQTVRRGTTAASPTIHQLLLHLESKGFSGSPRFLGLDDQQREILTYLDGETGIPDTNWRSDQPLVAAAKLLRQYHDATLDFDPAAPAKWVYHHADPKRHEVICHNDFAPYNFVYSNGVPYAVIDFDLAGPGPRLKDIAYTAYWMVPLSFNSEDQVMYTEADLQNGSRRLRMFCQSYGCSIEQDLFAMIEEVLTLMGSEEQAKKMVGVEAAQRLKADGHLAHWQRELERFQLNRSRIEANLFPE